MSPEPTGRAVALTAAAAGALVVRAVWISRWPALPPRALDVHRPRLARARLVPRSPALARRLGSRSRPLARVTLVDPPGGTTLDERGAARSVQAADLELSGEALEAIWSAALPERLETAYWRHIERLFAGLLRVRRGPCGAAILPLGLRPLALMRFGAPERATSPTSVSVCRPIAGGLLVARSGGSLEITAQRGEVAHADVLRTRVAVEGFHPAVARLGSRRIYLATQARVHVWVTHGYLRGLERLEVLA